MRIIKGRGRERLRKILRKSTHATCGFSEREVSVPASKVSSTIAALKSEGFHVIGTSYNQTPSKKIWFIRRGGL